MFKLRSEEWLGINQVKIAGRWGGRVKRTFQTKRNLRNLKTSVSREQVFVCDFGCATEFDCVLGFLFEK